MSDNTAGPPMWQCSCNYQTMVVDRANYLRLEQELAFVKTQWKQTSDLLEQERNRLTAELADVRKERDELLAHIATLEKENE